MKLRVDQSVDIAGFDLPDEEAPKSAESPGFPLKKKKKNMESPGAMSEREWNTFNGTYAPEEADFIAQLLGNCSLPIEPPGTSSFGVPSTLCPGHESTTDMSVIDEGLMYSSDNTNIYSFSRGTSYSGGSTSSLFPSPPCYESYFLIDSHQFLATNNSSISIDFCTGEVDKNTSLPVKVYTNNLMEMDDCLNGEISTDSMEESGVNLPDAVLHGKNLQITREPKLPLPETSAEDNESNLQENSKKRSRVSGDVQRKRVVKTKKNQKIVATNNNVEENNAGLQRQSSSTCCSEENFNASEELNEGVTSSSTSKGVASHKLNGKERASRESAYNPQSLYARKRRERINERLRILQNLVPNGTKVDISTMLEEVVQYVKFLQLQIKLLSSDDLWMYAPIAYNGIDIGLDLKITTAR